MNRISQIFLIVIFCLTGWAAPGQGGGTAGANTVGDSPPSGGPLPVQIKSLPDGFRLYRGGKPYYIKGVGGHRFLETAAVAGANSVRTWSARDAGPLFDRAQTLGLTVTLGLWLSHNPADYENPAYRERKTEEIRDLVEDYKGYPALLFWALGNEINLEGADTESAWRFVDHLARMIKALDPLHPIITVITCHAPTLDHIADYAPALDAVGINAYGSLTSLRAMVDASAYGGPYLITEWGVTGHWEARHTPWGRPIEPTSAWKAEYQLERYTLDILANQDRCIGSYVFLWGQKQERTPTWYSMILEAVPGGEDLASPMVDAMQFNWTGRWPANRAPCVSHVSINGAPAGNNIVLGPGEPIISQVKARDPENDPLTYVWELLEEPVQLGAGGSREEKPARLTGTVKGALPVFNLKAPLDAGEYRLFVYVLDGNGHVATANVPFKVQDSVGRKADAGAGEPGQG